MAKIDIFRYIVYNKKDVLQYKATLPYIGVQLYAIVIRSSPKS